MNRYYIGIDMGTSSAKIILLRDDGSVVGKVISEYSVDHPHPGWCEIDPKIWLTAVISGMEKLFTETNLRQVAGIGITGQMHTTVFLDKNGKSIRKAISWDDIRSKELLPILREKIFRFPHLKELSNILNTGASIASLYWLQQNEPENFRAIFKFLIGPDYLVYRMTGAMQTDYCEASTSGLFDMALHKWSEDIRKALNFPSSIYPDIKGSMCVAGTLLPYIADRLHLSHDIPVIVGTGDNVAAAYSFNMMKENLSFLSLGTSGVLVQCRTNYAPVQCGKRVFFSADGESFQYIYQAVLQSCGNCLNWWINRILGENLSIINNLPGGDNCSNNLLFYPHLTGEKSLYNDPDLRGAFLGLHSGTSKEDMIRAIFEGTAYGLRQLYDKTGGVRGEGASLLVMGGGSQSDIWMQILADVLNVTTVQLRSQSGAAYGIALMVMAAVDSGQMARALKFSCNAGKLFRPHPEKVAAHDVKYTKYRLIYRALKTIYA